jgi:hypothetical protein
VCRYARVSLLAASRDAGGALEQERLERARLFGAKGLNQVEELEGMMATLYNRACDLKQPVIWPSMALRLGA